MQVTDSCWEGREGRWQVFYSGATFALLLLPRRVHSLFTWMVSSRAWIGGGCSGQHVGCRRSFASDWWIPGGSRRFEPVISNTLWMKGPHANHSATATQVPLIWLAWWYMWAAGSYMYHNSSTTCNIIPVKVYSIRPFNQNIIFQKALI